jgi:D-glycero-D-manno-heptose 1,7-bisphosphate phosphatase
VGIGKALNPALNIAARAVFLDRDGVLNRAIVRDGKPYPPASLGELEIVEDAAGSLKRLKSLGFLLLVVTNQPDVARGTQTLSTIQAIHDAMRQTLPLDDFLICPHDDRDGCRCRKPLPGLLLDAQARFGIDFGRSFLVGDRWRDIDAGRAAGCRTVLLDHNYRERGPSLPPDAKVVSLLDAVDWIVRNSESEKDDHHDGN